MRDPDLIVVGAGVIGVSAAREMQSRGLRCVLIDAGEPGSGTSFGNAGHIATEQLQPLTQPGAWQHIPSLLLGRGPAGIVWRDLGEVLPWAWSFLRACDTRRVAAATRSFRALQADTGNNWRLLASQLPAVAALTQFLGHDEVFESGASHQRSRQDLSAAGDAVGAWRDLQPDELASLKKIAPTAIAGIRFTDSGYVKTPLGIVQALFADFEARGGRFLRAQVRSLQSGFSLSLENAEVRAPRVLIAAGARSARLLRPLGLTVPLIAERGYHLSFQRHIPGLMRPLVLKERSVVVTPMQFGFRSTSFVEFGSPGSPPTPGKWRRLQHHLAQAQITVDTDRPDRWMGERPTLPDYLPAIGESEAHPGLFYALGHQHLGLTLSPTTAVVLGDLIASGKRASFLDALSLSRFR